MSKEKLEEIEIMSQINLNLEDIPETKEDAEKKHIDAENTRKAKKKINLFTDNLLDLFDKDLIEQKETESVTKKLSRLNSSNLFNNPSLDNSEPGTSSASETLANEVTKLKI